jgi:sodium-dependent dicarboxylate transporter 2/3/5
MSPVRIAGLVAGVAAFLAIGLIDSPLHHVVGAGSRPAWAAAVAALMAIWWMTEALPIHVTACVPLLVFPLAGVLRGRAAEVATATVLTYVSDYVLLFAGGMCIGAAMQQHGLDRRIALSILRVVGTEPRRLLLGFLVATAGVSMWISNTAAAAMMLPIASAVIRQLEERAGGVRLAGYGGSLMLSIAYAANIGGIGTKIGTPPNMQLCGVLREMGIEVTFLQFAAIGLPFVLLMMPVAWALLWWTGKKDAPKSDAAGGTVAEEAGRLGPMSGGEWIVLAVFVSAAALWVGGKALADAAGLALKSSQVEGYVGVGAALVLVLARFRGAAVLGWKSLRAIPWPTLLLLGGSFAMAAGIERSGLSVWLGGELGFLRELPGFVQVLAASVACVAISAVASNTATVSVMLPLLRSAAAPAQLTTVLFASAFSASCDFALPAGTPPNAIVFGSGYVSFLRMAKTGVLLDFFAAALAAAWTWFVVPLVI